MSKIILTTLNARYSHTSLALRYLYANMHELQKDTQICEYVINVNIQEISQLLLQQNPTVIGFGVYIWNAKEIKDIIDTVKLVAPHIKIIVGGPEVSHLPHRVDFCKADYIICGEGEELFYSLSKKLLHNQKIEQRTFYSKGVNLEKIKLPYEFYSDFDIKNRHIYVESSRGCPYRCEFCLSSIDKKVRYFDFEIFLQELNELWNKGARNFKFVDRTFNVNIKKATALIDFFLEKEDEYFLHFEFIPDSFPIRLREKLKMFKKGSLQLEVGIQTLNEDVAKNIQRPLNMQKIEQNLHFLTSHTYAHLHLDLIIGLPGETMQSFGENLDKLMGLSNCEIQLGVLKKLSGTAIERHEKKYETVYNPNPPYDILQTREIDFLLMQKLKRFARYFDIVYNSGNFKQTIGSLWADGSVFENFYAFCEWFYAQTRATHQIALERMAKYLYIYLTEVKGLEKTAVEKSMVDDWCNVGARKLPKFLSAYAKEFQFKKVDKATKRQEKHA